MERTWLLQPGYWRSSPNLQRYSIERDIEYIDLYAAEYEQCFYEGKLRNPLRVSLERMTKNVKNYEFVKLARKDMFGNDLYVYCKKEDVEDVKENVKSLINGEQETKLGPKMKYCNMSLESFEKTKGHLANFWWDIENDYFIFYGEDKCNLIEDSFKRCAEKWEVPSEIPSENVSLGFFAKLLNSFKKVKQV